MTTIIPSLLQPRSGITSTTRVAATDDTPAHTLTIERPRTSNSTPVAGDPRRAEQIQTMRDRLEVVKEQHAAKHRGELGNLTLQSIESELESLTASLTYQERMDQHVYEREADKPAVIDGQPNEALSNKWTDQAKRTAVEIHVNRIAQDKGITRAEAFNVALAAHEAGTSVIDPR